MPGKTITWIGMQGLEVGEGCSAGDFSASWPCGCIFLWLDVCQGREGSIDAYVFGGCWVMECNMCLG